MKPFKSLHGRLLLAANLVAFLLLAAAAQLDATVAAEGQWCDPAGESEWCMCYGGTIELPGGCWDWPWEVEVDCFNSSHCGQN